MIAIINIVIQVGEAPPTFSQIFCLKGAANQKKWKEAKMSCFCHSKHSS